MAEKAVVATKAAKANQKKAVEAWASWQRLPVLGDEFVTLLCSVYNCWLLASIQVRLRGSRNP